MEDIFLEIMKQAGTSGLTSVLLWKIISLQRQKTKLERDAEFEKINQRIEKQDDRLNHHDEQFKRSNSRFSSMEGTLNDIRVGIGKIEAVMEFLKDKFK